MKRKIINAISVIVAIIIVVSVLFYQFRNEKEILISDLSSFQHLTDVKYEVLSAYKNGDSFVLDIFYKKKISDENMIELGRNLLTSLDEKKINKKHITIHQFSNKENYKSIKKDHYENKSGISQELTIHCNKKDYQAEIKTYIKPIKPESKKEKVENVDAVAYDSITMKEKNEKYFIYLVANGDEKAMSKFVIPYISLTKQLNPDINMKTVNLYMYPDETSYEEKNPSWIYKNNIIQKISDISDEISGDEEETNLELNNEVESNYGVSSGIVK